jgi:enamine deaminase RidA (YjgF/YER057c/UK114 family)
MTTRDDNFVAAAEALGFDLDMAEIRPVGHYVPVVLDSRYAYVAGQIPRVGDRIAVTGAAGRDATLEQARDGARICVMRLLTLLQSTLGSLDRVLQVMRMNVYVQSASDFTQQSEVADAASDILVQVLEDAGAHTRTSIGTYQLPKNATVEIDLIVAYEAEPINLTTMMGTLS